MLIELSFAYFQAGVALLLVFALTFKFLWVFKSSQQRNGERKYPSPPGPRPLPLLGNIPDMPRQHEWITITEWGRRFGDIVRVSVMGHNIIFLNSAKAATDLFEKRSAIYSDRPRLPLLNDLIGHEWNFGFMPYGETWRRHRRMFVSKSGPSYVHIFNSVQEHASAQLLLRLMISPEAFLDHLRLHAGQVIMMSVYGIQITSRQDRYIQVAQAVMDAVSEAARPGAWLVDAIPFLKYVPAWFPGAFYQRMAKKWANDLDKLRWAPFLASKARLAEGKQSSVPSYVTELLEEYDSGMDDAEAMIRDTAALAYGAASDTSVSSLSSFILAMVLFPEVQKRAQAELDATIGASRLPSFSDRQNLPYMTAVAKETLRWHTVGPQSLPHQLRSDDVYKGYFLPAGSIIVGNTWSILHDPDMYPEPMDFKPERYFNTEGKLDYAAIDPAKFSFGYGRRICAGLHYAENTLWITIACILSTLNIQHSTDVDGKPIPVSVDTSSGVISHPGPFKCKISVRSEQAKMLIEQANITSS